MYPAQVFRFVRGQETIEKVYNTPSGGRVLTVARRKRPRDEGEESAIDERIAVDEKESRRRRWRDNWRFEGRRG